MTKSVTIKPKSNTKIQVSCDSTKSLLTVDNQGVNVEVTSYEDDGLELTFTNPDSVTKTKLENPGDNSLNAGQIIGVIIAVILCVVCVLACVFITRCEAKEDEQELAKDNEME